MNNNLPQSEPLSFIGQDLYQSGMLGAELLHQGERAEGTYAILHIYDDIETSKFLNEKERGFKDYFKEQGKSFKVISLDLNYNHIPTLETELKELLANANLRGILITTSTGAKVVSKLLEKRGKNNVKLVAYDLLKDNISYLEGWYDRLSDQPEFQTTSLCRNQATHQSPAVPEVCCSQVFVSIGDHIKKESSVVFRFGRSLGVLKHGCSSLTGIPESWKGNRSTTK